MTESLLYKELSYKIIGICMEVHSILGKGHSEVVYKDALEYEFKQAGIGYSREKKYKIQYKDTTLPHYYFADFIVEECIVLETKAATFLVESHMKQSLNYLAASRLRLALLVNFGEDSLTHKRIIF